VGSAYALDLHSEGGVEGRTIEPKAHAPADRALLLACFSQSLSLVGWITLLLQGPVPRSRTFWGKAMKSKLHPRFH
jgi:hypothetical protein